MTSISLGKKNSVAKSMIVAGLGLYLSLGAFSLSAQQNQPDDAQTTVEPRQMPQPQPAQDQPVDQQAPAQQPQQQPPQFQGPPQNQVAPPASLTLPAGTVVRVRVNQWLSTDRNIIGDEFSATLDQPIVVDGWVVARRGQSETGRVSLVRKQHGSTTSQLGLQVSELTLVDGQQLPIQTELAQSTGGGPSTTGRDVAIVGTTTGAGAVIGGVAGGGTGAVVGAGLGAIGGLIGVTTRGKPTVIPPETVLTFRLDAPITISTGRSQSAFQPVTQDDYNSRAEYARPQRFAPNGATGYPAPAPYYGYPYAYYGYGYPYPYAYPYGYGFYPGFGFYGGYGFGFRGGFGGGVGRGFRR